MALQEDIDELFTKNANHMETIATLKQENANLKQQN